MIIPIRYRRGLAALSVLTLIQVVMAQAPFPPTLAAEFKPGEVWLDSTGKSINAKPKAQQKNYQ